MRKRIGTILFLLIGLVSPATSIARLPHLPWNAGLFGLFRHKGDPPPPGTVLRKNQAASIEKVELKKAENSCGNWAWVAAVVNVAKSHGAQLEQRYLVDRLYGGSVCREQAGDPEQLARQISHDYVLEDGQKFRLEARFISGTPTQADPLILSLRQSRPVMLFWRNQPYLLTGMEYDEYIATTGSRLFIVTQLKLFDPADSGEHPEVTFVRGRDNPDELNGMLELTVIPK